MLLSRATATAWLTGIGVLVVGIADWVMGVAPEAVIPISSDVGLVVFVAAVVGVIACSVGAARGLDGSPSRRLQWGSIALATVASLVGDPSYAVLLFAVPLVDIARGRHDANRLPFMVGVFALAVGLVALENSWAGNDLESALSVFLALAITALLGDALGRLDDSARREAELARVDERRNLAGELHDSVGHSLLASSIQLRNADALWDRQPDAARHAVSLAGRAVEEALVDTRFAVDRIRAEGDPFDLGDALGELVQRIASPTLTVELDVADEADRVDQVAQITLYRVAQEALTNVVRHAEASRVRVEHRVDATTAHLCVVDDGVGFEHRGDGHAGLRSLTERVARVGGQLDVGSAHGEGTRVSASVAIDR